MIATEDVEPVDSNSCAYETKRVFSNLEQRGQCKDRHSFPIHGDYCMRIEQIAIVR
jgi:hypothetical protein